MATTVRSTTRSTSGSSSAPSVTPASQTTGDVLVIVVHANSNPITIVQESTQAGTNPLTVDIAASGQVSHTVAVFSRRIVGGDPTTWNFTLGSAQRVTVVAQLWQSPNAGAIYDVSPTLNLYGSLTGSSPGVDAPTITTNTANAIHCAVVGADGQNLFWDGSPAGYTLDSPAVALPADGGDEVLAWSHKIIAAPGATGAQNYTWNSTTGCFGISFAIKDVGAGGVARMASYLAQQRNE